MKIIRISNPLPRALTIVTPVVDVSFLHHTERERLEHLAAQPSGQALQRGQVLDLQVVHGDVAVVEGAAVEVVEELLEDVVDANARQDVALFYVAVQGLGDEPFITGIRSSWREQNISEFSKTRNTQKLTYQLLIIS